MSPRPSAIFNCPPIEQLAQHLLSSSTARRLNQLQRAEKLHDEVEPGATYPVDFLGFKLTGFRRDYGDDSLLVGEAVRPDLRLLIDQLSKSLDLPLSDEDAQTADQLALKLNVSTKTISRWRKAGLRWRWVQPLPGARKVIAFTDEAVQRFTDEQSGRVSRASNFTQLTDKERDELIERARRLASASDATLNRIASHLARRSNRAVETIRLILEKHDRDHPDQIIFTDRTGPLTPRQKRLISRAHRMGVGVGKLSERFRRSRASIHRVILDRRAARALRLPLASITHPNFVRPDAEEVYLRAKLEPRHPDPRRTTVPLDGLPDPLRLLYVQPVVSPDKIRSLFLRYNFLKYIAAQTREAFAHAPAKARDLDRFEYHINRASRVRSLLVTWHLPVALSVARRHLIGQPASSTSQLVRLLEKANPVLIDAVEDYNAAKQPTFDSFLTNRLLRAFAAVEQGPAKAQRRVDAEQVVNRMIDLAGESGVRLALNDPEESEGTED